MNSLPVGIASTLAARVWTALLGLLFVPIQIRYLGLEAFGLLGFLLSLQALLAVVDFGLSYSLVRELATKRDANAAARRLNAIRTLELFYWGVALVVAMLMFVLAPWIARWVNASQLPQDTLIAAFRIFALVMLVQLPTAIYTAGLSGLERQLTLNAVNASVATIRVLGGLVVLTFISAKVTSLLAWFALAAATGTFTMKAALAAGTQRPGVRASFDPLILRSNFRYASGVSVILTLTIVLTQLDRLILGRVVNLEALGAYSVAASVCAAILFLPGVITAPLFPRFSALAASGDDAGLRRVYHLGSQAITVLVFPPALMLSAFAPEIVHLWIRDGAVVEHGAPVLRVLALATAIGSLTALPFTLQAALGRNRIVLVQYIFLLGLAVPSLVGAAIFMGPRGIAFAWLALYLGQVLAVTPLVHRQSVSGEHGYWLWRDVLAPILACGAVVVVCRLALPQGLPASWLVLTLLACGAASMAAAFLACSALRREAPRAPLLRRAPR